jgi:hypothetical protein
MMICDDKYNQITNRHTSMAVQQIVTLQITATWVRNFLLSQRPNMLYNNVFLSHS